MVWGHPQISALEFFLTREDGAEMLRDRLPFIHGRVGSDHWGRAPINVCEQEK